MGYSGKLDTKLHLKSGLKVFIFDKREKMVPFDYATVERWKQPKWIPALEAHLIHEGTILGEGKIYIAVKIYILIRRGALMSNKLIQLPKYIFL